MAVKMHLWAREIHIETSREIHNDKHFKGVNTHSFLVKLSCKKPDTKRQKNLGHFLCF